MTKTLRAIGLIILLCADLFSPSLQGATGTLTPSPYLTVFDSNGDPISGACVWTYTAGTTNQVATYTDVNLAVPNANPIIADSAGRFVAYLTQGVSYKFVFETACTPPAHGATIKTSDNIAAVPGVAGGVDVAAFAGEGIIAGNCVYMSDGSGGKTQGGWYKCDTGNTYSSLLPPVGMAPSAITSNTIGSVRIAGQITGLSSLTVGADYYVSTAGAITSTPPTPRRWIGRASDASTLTIDPNPPPPLVVSATANDFRLSLTTGLCVTSSDVTAATTLFWTQCNGGKITLADASSNLETCATTEKNIAVPNVASQMYDVFVSDSTFGTCTVVLSVLAWTNDVSRATQIVRTGTSFWVKSGDTTSRYVGSFRTTAVAGQTEDSVTKRYLWNAYNRMRRPLQRFETADTWNYNTATIRQANANTANQVDVIVGLVEAALDLHLLIEVKNNAGSVVQVVAGIGEDSTTTIAVGQSGTTNSANFVITLAPALVKIVPAGRHFYSWNEWSQATATTTWVARDSSSAALTNSLTGLTGWIEG